MAKKIEVPEWVFALWRFARVFISAGVAQAVIVRPDWANVEESVKAISVAFVAGLISAVFKYLRDKGYLTRLPL